MNRDSGALLSVRDLVVRYGAGRRAGRSLTAVRGVSFDIAPASIFGLVGESGSGKTSLSLAIPGLIKAASGQVLFHGRDLAAAGGARAQDSSRNIQLVFQDPLASLSPRRSVLQALLEPLNHFGIGTAAGREDRAAAALETVGLDPALRRRFPAELSGGQRQRVALARALVAEPELIIADEPLSSLDVTVQARIIELILDLREKLGLSFLLVSHDLAVVGELADTVAVMYLGRIVEYAPAERLFSAPAHPYSQALLAAVPVADPGSPAPVVLRGEPPSPLTPPAGCAFHNRCPDAFTACKSEAPGEHVIEGAGRLTRAGEPVNNGGHRVRCHLWKSGDRQP